MPRKIRVNSMQGIDAMVVVTVTVARGMVWISIGPPFTGEAIIDTEKIDEVIRALELARNDAVSMVAAFSRRSLREIPSGPVAR